MKKKQFKNYLKIGVLLLGILFTTVNCEQDGILQNENLENAQNPIKAEQVAITDIPTIVNSIKIFSNKSIGFKNKEDTEFLIDSERIIKATDSIGNITYAFEILTKDDADNVLYNLIVTERINGQKTPDFIVKYEFINATKYNYASPAKDQEFEAKMSIYSYAEFANRIAFQNKTTESTDPCAEITTTTGTSTGNGIDNNDTSSYIDGQEVNIASSYTSGYTVIQLTGSSSGGGGTVMCGMAEIVSFGNTVDSANKSQESIIKAKSSTEPDPCPEGDILLPINKNPDQIIDTNLTGKEKCLNEKLTENGNTFVKDLLANFEGISEFDINISSKDNIYSDKRKKFANGQTSYKSGDKFINISISTDKLSDMPVLAGIRTILHEYIHADIYRKLNTKDDANEEAIKDFKETYEKYEREDHHNSMATLYINSMTKSLKEIHQKILLPEYNYLSDNGTKSLDDLYEALAWQGLKNHKLEAWKNLGNDTVRINTALNMDYSSLTTNCPE